MKSPREVLGELFEWGWGVSEGLDQTPKETYIDKALSALAEIVRDVKPRDICRWVHGDNEEYCSACEGIEWCIDHIAKLFTDKEQTK